LLLPDDPVSLSALAAWRDDHRIRLAVVQRPQHTDMGVHQSPSLIKLVLYIRQQPS